MLTVPSSAPVTTMSCAHNQGMQITPCGVSVCACPHHARDLEYESCKHALPHRVDTRTCTRVCTHTCTARLLVPSVVPLPCLPGPNLGQHTVAAYGWCVLLRQLPLQWAELFVTEGEQGRRDHCRHLASVSP